MMSQSDEGGRKAWHLAMVARLPFAHQRLSCRAANAHSRRRGSLMLEMVVAAVMLSTVAAILVPGIYAVHQQRQATRFDALSLIELNNLSAVTRNNGAADGDTLKLSEWFTKRYVDATLEVEEVASAAVDVPLRALRFTIVRPAGDSRPDFRHSMVAWVSAREVQE
ncbi:MAG: hypothetical protein GY903_11290 [Fuerstiella sp.]|nr:hypothetical protein [Fuerstiella sp.]MCP4855066.1 hypothetical protein [Fuerstiella sp.]